MLVSALPKLVKYFEWKFWHTDTPILGDCCKWQEPLHLVHDFVFGCYNCLYPCSLSQKTILHCLCSRLILRSIEGPTAHNSPASIRVWEETAAKWWGKRRGTTLIGGFNPCEKYARQIGSFPQSRGENKQWLKPPPRTAPTPVKHPNLDLSIQSNLIPVASYESHGTEIGPCTQKRMANCTSP